jgi:hypothetical protein
MKKLALTAEMAGADGIEESQCKGEHKERMSRNMSVLR